MYRECHCWLAASLVLAAVSGCAPHYPSPLSDSDVANVAAYVMTLRK